jgi:hypothetical protein
VSGGRVRGGEKMTGRKIRDCKGDKVARSMGSNGNRKVVGEGNREEREELRVSGE